MIRLAYGNDSIEFALHRHAEILSIQEPTIRISEEIFRHGITPFLKQLLPTDNLAIVVADKTRLCGYETVLPWLVKSLREKGLRRQQITFYIAYGTHQPQDDRTCRHCYGQVYDEYHFIHHHCDHAQFTELGKTQRGTPILICQDILESDAILTIGAVSHHYFAGYGGGRKLLFPGLAERSAIHSNHSLYLNRQTGNLEEQCQPGSLDTNPIAEDLKEINSYLPDYFSIHGILNSDGQLADFLFGSGYDVFLSACSRLDGYYRHENTKEFDIVLASAGGSPKDINFIQAHKAIHNSSRFVREGGQLIMLARCPDQIGSTTFLPYFSKNGFTQAFAGLIDKYSGNGGTALAMMKKTDRIAISLLTDLTPDTCKKIGVQKWDITRIQNALADEDTSLAIIPNASLLI
ncbi:lactate racemase domain-containing protein [Desulfogranum japonicum]|uniref:lactate racemase domain-containing protein n=1 Tax=Desulfogranum japonicum TaxID=231447 RepID=UPI00042448E4|nr:lactate racemase domain-containing protein [Desulfogranum japonicum]